MILYIQYDGYLQKNMDMIQCDVNYVERNVSMAQEQFNKTRTTITLDTPVYQEIFKLAQEDERSVSFVINKAMAEWLKERESK